MTDGIDTKFIGHGGVLLGGDIERCWESTGWGTEFDAIISLGGNCSVAHNLRIRDLRNASYPFDWLLMDDSMPIDYLVKGFDNEFADFCLKENLVELVGDERGMEKPGRLQFRDKVSGWKLIHHFNVTSDFNAEFCRVHATLRRRISRMLANFASGGRYLLVLAPTFSVDEGCVDELRLVLRRKYPRSSFFLLVMSFCERESGVEISENVLYSRIARPQNIYDFSKTGIEWSFLDRLSLKVGCMTKRVHKLRLWKHRGIRYVLRWYVEKKMKGKT